MPADEFDLIPAVIVEAWRMTVPPWLWSGLPELRADDLLRLLQRVMHDHSYSLVHHPAAGEKQHGVGPCSVPRVVVDGVAYYPHYVSTACIHGEHARCRDLCKYGPEGEPCQCAAHACDLSLEDGPETPCPAAPPA